MSKFIISNIEDFDQEEKFKKPLNILGFVQLILDHFKNRDFISIDDAIEYIKDKIKERYNGLVITKSFISFLENYIKNNLIISNDNEIDIKNTSKFSSAKFKTIVLSQADPLAAMMGGPALPMAGAPAPAAPPAPEASAVITGPIDTLAKLVSDADVETKIKSNPDKAPEDIAMEVWLEYGGSETGDIDSTKTGQRTDDDADNDPAKVEKQKDRQNETGTQYERLPQGQSLADIDVSLEGLTEAIKSMPFSIIQKVKGQQGGGAAGGGMPGMMASAKFKIYKNT